MHQTTVRFGADLWEALEQECEMLGVSIAQYVREAALVRLAYAAARRGDPALEAALELVTDRLERDRAASAEGPGVVPPAGETITDEPITSVHQAADSRERAQIEVSESSALWAQGRQVRRRAKQLRDARARGRASR